MTAETPNPRPPSATEGVFSLEDLDKIIEAEDPNFKSQMDDIKSARVEDTSAVESLQIATEEDLVKEDESVKSRKQKIIDFLLAPWRRLNAFLRIKRIALKNRIVMFIDTTKNFVRHELPDRIKYWRSQMASGWQWLKLQWKQLMAMSRLQKSALVFMFVVGVGALALLSRTITGAWLPHYTDPLPRSLAHQSEFKGRYAKIDDLQLLFQAFPEVEYTVLLSKVIVNLRPDPDSSPNPMGVFEFFVGVDSQDTAVEVKDRERELLDIIQRTVEGFTYSEINTKLGKVRMKSEIRDQLNKVLNQGQVFHLYLNTIVINP